MSSDDLPELTDADIVEMARQAAGIRPDIPHAAIRLFRRRAAIRAGVIPLPDVSFSELVWQLREAVRRSR